MKSGVSIIKSEFMRKMIDRNGGCFFAAKVSLLCMANCMASGISSIEKSSFKGILSDERYGNKHYYWLELLFFFYERFFGKRLDFRRFLLYK